MVFRKFKRYSYSKQVNLLLFKRSTVLNYAYFRPDDDNFDEIFLKLLKDSIKISSKNDKIRANSLRAMGNLLLLITDELWIKKDFRDASIEAVGVLVQNASTCSSMKVVFQSTKVVD